MSNLQQSTPVAMTDQHWQAVTDIVSIMRSAKVKANELKKIVAYIRWWRNRHTDEAIGDHLFEYLQVLIIHGDAYSKSAAGYREKILDISRQSLDGFKHDTDSVIQILGWATRLV